MQVPVVGADGLGAILAASPCCVLVTTDAAAALATLVDAAPRRFRAKVQAVLVAEEEGSDRSYWAYP